MEEGGERGDGGWYSREREGVGKRSDREQGEWEGASPF